jgi:hypothetical protein
MAIILATTAASSAALRLPVGRRPSDSAETRGLHTLECPVGRSAGGHRRCLGQPERCLATEGGRGGEEEGEDSGAWQQISTLYPTRRPLGRCAGGHQQSLATEGGCGGEEEGEDSGTKQSLDCGDRKPPF